MKKARKMKDYNNLEKFRPNFSRWDFFQAREKSLGMMFAT